MSDEWTRGRAAARPSSGERRPRGGGLFLMSEVPLYLCPEHERFPARSL